MESGPSKMAEGYPKLTIRTLSLKAKTSMAGIESQKRKLEDDIKYINRRVKNKKHPSFDMTIWADLRDIQSAKIKANGLQHKISKLSMDIDDDDDDEESVEQWASTTEAKAILEQEVALNKGLLLMTRQHKRVTDQSKDNESQKRRSWTEMFINARFGMNVIKPSKRRSNERQKQFRSELIEVMKAKYPDEASVLFWCPVMGDWYHKVEASHLFPSKSGDDLMKLIFGEAEQDMWIGKPEKGQSELFRACNGILRWVQVESRFSRGLFTIVPDLDERPSLTQSEAWQRSSPKEYRIRVLRPEHPDMIGLIQGRLDIRWKDLDNKRPQWRSDFRPRARYLYWSYCEMMLRQTYSNETKTTVADVRRQELGKKYWGSAGPYMKRNMLLGFVEEMGHEYEHLLEGAMDEGKKKDYEDEDDEDTPKEAAVMLANESIMEKAAIVKWKESRADMENRKERERDYDREQ